MQQRFDDYGAGPTQAHLQRGGFNARTALLAFAFCTFVLGGFAFGWLFMANWKLLEQFQAARIDLPAGPWHPTVPPQSGRRSPRLPGRRRVVVPPVPG